MTISDDTTRRDFLKTGTTAALAGGILASSGLASHSDLAAGIHAGGAGGVLKIGLVGCGARGTGAVGEALAADKNIQMVALGDLFADKVEGTVELLKKHGKRAEVPKANRFSGWDAYKKVIALSDVVLLATTPHFRPVQLKAAVDAGKHVFCEKPIAVDAPGCRSVKETVELARKKNLSLVSGLCWRYHSGIQAGMKQIHDGTIGDVVAMDCAYNTTGGKPIQKREPGWSDMEWQQRNWHYFTWLSGDHIVEQHVHSLDKMLWAVKEETPVSCSSIGGRQTRTDEAYGNVFDHFATEFTFKNGMKVFSRCRQQKRCRGNISDHIYGSKGRCDINWDRMTMTGQKNWNYKGPKCNMYVSEHEALFKSIRAGKPINNGTYMVNNSMMAIMARTSAYTGKNISWEEMWKSKLDLSPAGGYKFGNLAVRPVATPGTTQFI